MITMAAWAATLLKWVYTHRNTDSHKYTLKQSCAQAQSIRHWGRGRDSTFIYRVYFTCFSWFIIYESINLYDTAAAYRVGLAAFLPIFPSASFYASVSLWPEEDSSLSIKICLLCKLSLPLFTHFLSLFFCLSLYIFVIRLVPFILWSFIPSLKHFKLWWWLANLSQINLMGSACTHSPHGCAFTAVLLIYSWKTTLQCPSFKIEKGQSLLSNPLPHLLLHP